jgi:hypothetical protein
MYRDMTHVLDLEMLTYTSHTSIQPAPTLPTPVTQCDRIWDYARQPIGNGIITITKHDKAKLENSIRAKFAC